MQIIFLIIIIALVVNSNKKKTANSKKEGSSKIISSYQSQSSTAPNRMQNGNRNVTGKPANSKSTSGKMAGSKPANGRTDNRAAMNAKATKVQKQESVVEYLNKKAAEDQAEHLEEERRAAIRHKKMYGNAKVGGRLLLGDAVPRGMMKVDCAYCGAENLLRPGDRGNCLCYFCRTKL